MAQGTDLAGEVRKLSGAWNKKRPFSRTPDSPHTYAIYRKKLFDQFLAPLLQQLPEKTGLAELITRDATAWAFYLHSQAPTTPHSQPITPLRIPISSKEERILERLPLVRPEISAETDTVQLRAILTVRRLFKQRNDLIRLTVNDLLILYRIIHAFSYQPSPDLENVLRQLQSKRQSKPIADQILAELTNNKQHNPAILIPIDATARDPKDRIYPMMFEAPLRDMNLIALHQETLTALNAYETAQGNRKKNYTTFDTKQRDYLAALAAFGAILSRAKEIAIEHDSASISTLKLLAHMPPAIQNLLDQIPSRFDALNDLIKGREVFSNTGAVVPSSSLTRFNTAKDDNESKFLAWGVLTDSKGVMRVSLRDFRPFIAPLIELGQRHIAQQITQDYLHSYAEGLNQFVHELRQIVSLSRETQIYRPEIQE